MLAVTGTQWLETYQLIKIQGI